MAVMHMAGAGSSPARGAEFWEEHDHYRISLDVSGFAENELRVEVRGMVVTVRGDHEGPEDDGAPFHIQTRLVKSFRLPADAAVDDLSAALAHATLGLRVPRRPDESRIVPVEHDPYRVNPDAAPC